MIAELLVLASLLRLDPSGDAHGAGDLIPPTAQVYSSLGPFDLVAVEVVDAPLLVLRVRLGEIPDPGGLPNGLTLGIVDVYLDTGEGGREDLLPGPDMRMPPGRGWDIAIRVHGDDAYAVLAADPDGAPRPVTVVRADDVLRIEVPVPAPAELVELHALTGVYDPFSIDGWRPLAESASPWAFASEFVVPPVVDLLAEDDDTQRAALQAFTLPSAPRGDTAIGWLIAMAAGLAVAIAGLWLRRRVPPPVPTPATSEGDAMRPSPVPDDSGEAVAGSETGADRSAVIGAEPGADTDAGMSADTPVDAGSSDSRGDAPSAQPPSSASGRDGAELVLPTIWATSDGWWSETESESADDPDPAPEGAADPSDVERPIGTDDLIDTDEGDAPHDAPDDASDDAGEEDADDVDRDGGPRSSTGRGDGAS